MELHEIAQLLSQGQIGAANSRYAILIGTLTELQNSLEPEARRDSLRLLRTILRCQQQEDWIGMADALEYGLAPLFR